MDSFAECEQARTLLLHLLSHREAMAESIAMITSVVAILAEEFERNQDALKFTLCDTLYSVLSATGEVSGKDGLT